MTSAETTTPTVPVLTPQCQVGLLYEPGWRDGHPACRAPGYKHGVLGWVTIPCACQCHTEGVAP